MTFLPVHFSNLFLLCIAAIIFHGALWLRNGRFLWRNRRVILAVVVLCEVWTLVTDPIGGQWRTWLFDPDKVLGIWLFGVTPLENFFGMAVVSSATACAILVFGYSKRRWI